MRCVRCIWLETTLQAATSSIFTVSRSIRTSSVHIRARRMTYNSLHSVVRSRRRTLLRATAGHTAPPRSVEPGSFASNTLPLPVSTTTVTCWGRAPAWKTMKGFWVRNRWSGKMVWRTYTTRGSPQPTLFQPTTSSTDGGPPTSANHCWTPSIRCARPHGLELPAGRPPRTAGLRVL